MENEKADDDNLDEKLSELGLYAREKADKEIIDALLKYIDKLQDDNQELVKSLQEEKRDLIKNHNKVIQKLLKRLVGIPREISADPEKSITKIEEQKRVLREFAQVGWRRALLRGFLNEKVVSRPRAGEITGYADKKNGLTYISSQIKSLKDVGIIKKEKRRYRLDVTGDVEAYIRERT